MIKNKRLFGVIGLIFMMTITMLSFTGCSADGSDVWSNKSSLTYECTYNSAEDITEIVFHLPFENKSNFNITQLSLDFKMSNDGVFLRNTEDIIYKINIRYGETKWLYGKFFAYGEVDEIEFISFWAEQVGLWESYEVWWIVTIVVAILIAIIGIIIIFVQDLEVDDFFEWIDDFSEEHLWIIFPFVPIIILYFTEYWIGGLIILGGLVSAFVVMMITFLVKYIIDNVGLGGYSYVDNGGNVESYEELTVVELKEECSARGLKGYSKLKKQQLIESLETDDEVEEVDERSKDKKFVASNIIKQISKDYIPTIKLTDIAGLDEAKLALEERVILPLKHKEIYSKYNKKVGGGIFLYGLPGTGKTMFAQAVATELDAKFYSIKCSDIESKWIGEAEKNVRNLFAKARKDVKAVIFFDEFDSIGKKRTADDDNRANTVQEILAQMQGIETSSNLLLVIAATNCPWNVDGALLRPGRFDEKIYIPLPDKKAITFILNKELKSIPFTNNVDLSVIADKLVGCNGADITEFCEKIKMRLIRKEIDKRNDDQKIDVQELEEILQKTKTSVLKRDIQNMEEFIKNHI